IIDRRSSRTSSSSGIQCTDRTSWLGRRSASPRRRKTKGAIARSTGRSRAIARTSSSAPRYSASRERSTPISSSVSRTAVARASASPGSDRPPGNAICPDQGSSGCSARRMKSSSTPTGPSRRTRATAARPPTSPTRAGGRAASAPRTSLQPRLLTSRFYRPGGSPSGEEGLGLGQPEEGHVRRESAFEQHAVHRFGRKVGELVDLRGLGAEGGGGNVGAARVDGHVVEHVAHAAVGGGPHVAQIPLERDPPQHDVPLEVGGAEKGGELLSRAREPYARRARIVEQLFP